MKKFIEKIFGPQDDWMYVILMNTYSGPLVISLILFTNNPEFHSFNIIYCIVIMILLNGYKLGLFMGNIALIVLGLIVLFTLFNSTFIQGLNNLSFIALMLIFRDILSLKYLSSIREGLKKSRIEP